MTQEIIPPETRQAFARVGAKIMGGGLGLRYFFLREEMAKLGIETREVLETTWAGRQTETLPTEERFQGYYATVNWRCRDDVRRILPAFEKIMLAVLGHYEPSFLDDIAQHLERDGLRISSQGKICWKKSLGNLEAGI